MKRASKFLFGSIALASLIAIVPGRAASADETTRFVETAFDRARCGTRGSPPSPLQVIMRGIDKKNAGSVRAALHGISEPPAGFSNWTKFVETALASAEDGDFDPAAVEVACKACHTENRMRFQHEDVRCEYRK